eukprot:TRINITY_DN7002_c2_g1_i1.p5 TRINITY_DN7002_c2_g1~~TRINITY_DN7002_c2_g1_i1.p5  ORF type:complete len:136 (+),score=2.74 TRINITY_DN7002_c2_g1_i1:543-950(+)
MAPQPMEAQMETKSLGVQRVLSRGGPLKYRRSSHFIQIAQQIYQQKLLFLDQLQIQPTQIINCIQHISITIIIINIITITPKKYFPINSNTPLPINFYTLNLSQTMMLALKKAAAIIKIHSCQKRKRSQKIPQTQ